MGCDYYIEKSLYITFKAVSYAPVWFFASLTQTGDPKKRVKLARKKRPKDSYDISYITLERNSGYFIDISLDEDDPKYDKEYKKMIKDCLTPTMSPILIYENDQFVNEKLEKKYKKLIQDCLNEKTENTNFSQIKEIWKKESRYERD